MSLFSKECPITCLARTAIETSHVSYSCAISFDITPKNPIFPNHLPRANCDSNVACFVLMHHIFWHDSQKSQFSKSRASRKIRWKRHIFCIHASFLSTCLPKISKCQVTCIARTAIETSHFFIFMRHIFQHYSKKSFSCSRECVCLREGDGGGRGLRGNV